MCNVCEWCFGGIHFAKFASKGKPGSRPQCNVHINEKDGEWVLFRNIPVGGPHLLRVKPHHDDG
jgi:hypothetical protein